MGGDRESRIDGLASDWNADAPEFHVLAVECHSARKPLPLTGLPDDAFEHDGQITKREIRALSVESLAPRRGAVLWDIGAGSGAIAIEWMRAGEGAQAIAIEPMPARAARIEENARALGVPELQLATARAPECLGSLEAPDAVFIGGGLSEAHLVSNAWTALKPGGRLVANAVTLEGEQVLNAAQVQFGGI